MLALAPLPAALVLSLVWRQGSAAVIVGGALLAATLGFALAKVRTDFVARAGARAQYGFADVRGFVELVEPRPVAASASHLRLVAVIGGCAEDEHARSRPGAHHGRRSPASSPATACG